MDEPETFDFVAHANVAVTAYLNKQDYYRSLSGIVARILEECLKSKGIKVHSVQHRHKDPKSLLRKASIPSESDPNMPKYNNPLSEITDLSAVRIITHFLGTVSDVDEIIRREFEVVEKSDKGLLLLEEEKFGYQSMHYLVKIGQSRSELSEYALFKNEISEIQVRTILQHAWAEIEHDIQYKSSEVIPTEVRRRFMALAGMLEIADREFEAIQIADEEMAAKAEVSVDKGELAGVEITPKALKQFLDKRIGSDGRISDWNYSWYAKLLKKLGFRDLESVEKAILGYNDDKLSVISYGNRQGQTTRFELMLLAAMGNIFIDRHQYAGYDWFIQKSKLDLQKFEKAKITLGSFDPLESS